MPSKLLSDGISHLQSQSRIPLNTWRKWCELLKLDPREAVKVWDEICYPIMIATNKLPEVTYILQMRTYRLGVDIRSFKDETARILHFITFLYNLKDDRLTKGKIKTNLLKFYREISLQEGGGSSSAFTAHLVRQLCAVVLIAKVLRGASVSLSGVLNLITEKRGGLEQMRALGLRALQGTSYGGLVRESLEATGIPSPEEVEPQEAGGGELPEEDLAAAIEAEEQQAGGEEAGEKNSEEPATSEFSGAEEADLDAAAAIESAEAEEAAQAISAENGDGEPPAAAEEPPDPAVRAMENYLMKFKTALHVIYEAEAKPAEDPAAESAEAEEEEEDINAKLLDTRLRVIAGFDPLKATIPSLEEAQLIARRAEIARAPKRIYKPSIKPTKPGMISMGGAAPPGGGASENKLKEVLKAATQTQPAAGPVQQAKPKLAPVPAARAEPNSAAAVAPADMVEAKPANKAQFSDDIHRIASTLATVEKADQLAWSLFLDPGGMVKDAQALARTLTSQGTGANQAYQAIKTVAQHIPLKNLIPASDQSVQKDRNLMLKVTTFINTVTKTNKGFEPTDRQMTPLREILDYAGAALLRLEALRVNHNFGKERKEDYSREAVIAYYEEALRSITDLVDRDLLAKARPRADQDTDSLVEIFAAERFADNVVAICREYVQQLRREGNLQSVDQVQAAFEMAPLWFEGAAREEQRLAEMPEELTAESGMGEVFDTVSRYLCTEAWAVMRPVHKPDRVAGRIKAVLREELTSVLVFKPEKRRHADNSRLTISVIGLDKVCNNQGFANYFVRVHEDGRIMYAENFEDGTYVDVFELREYQPIRMHVSAKKQSDAEGTEPLQTGHKYLYTVARINRLAGQTASELFSTCIRKEDGTPKIFPIFE